MDDDWKVVAKGKTFADKRGKEYSYLRSSSKDKTKSSRLGGQGVKHASSKPQVNEKGNKREYKQHQPVSNAVTSVNVTSKTPVASAPSLGMEMEINMEVWPSLGGLPVPPLQSVISSHKDASSATGGTQLATKSLIMSKSSQAAPAKAASATATEQTTPVEKNKKTKKIGIFDALVSSKNVPVIVPVPLVSNRAVKVKKTVTARHEDEEQQLTAKSLQSASPSSVPVQVPTTSLTAKSAMHTHKAKVLRVSKLSTLKKKLLLERLQRSMSMSMSMFQPEPTIEVTAPVALTSSSGHVKKEVIENENENEQAVFAVRVQGFVQEDMIDRDEDRDGDGDVEMDPDVQEELQETMNECTAMLRLAGVFARDIKPQLFVYNPTPTLKVTAQEASSSQSKYSKYKPAVVAFYTTAKAVKIAVSTLHGLVLGGDQLNVRAIPLELTLKLFTSVSERERVKGREGRAGGGQVWFPWKHRDVFRKTVHGHLPSELSNYTSTSAGAGAGSSENSCCVVHVTGLVTEDDLEAYTDPDDGEDEACETLREVADICSGYGVVLRLCIASISSDSASSGVGVVCILFASSRQAHIARDKLNGMMIAGETLTAVLAYASTNTHTHTHVDVDVVKGDEEDWRMLRLGPAVEGEGSTASRVIVEMAMPAASGNADDADVHDSTNSGSESDSSVSVSNTPSNTTGNAKKKKKKRNKKANGAGAGAATISSEEVPEHAEAEAQTQDQASSKYKLAVQAPKMPKPSINTGADSIAFANQSTNNSLPLLPIVTILTDSEQERELKEMLVALAAYQKAAILKDPVKGRFKLRLVSGLNQCSSAVKTGKAKLVLIAPDIESSEELHKKLTGVYLMCRPLKEQIVSTDTEVDSNSKYRRTAAGLVKNSADIEDDEGIPVMYCLSRRKLARAIGANTRQSIVVVTDPEGTFPQYKKFLRWYRSAATDTINVSSASAGAAKAC